MLDIHEIIVKIIHEGVYAPELHQVMMPKVMNRWDWWNQVHKEVVILGQVGDNDTGISATSVKHDLNSFYFDSGVFECSEILYYNFYMVRSASCK